MWSDFTGNWSNHEVTTPLRGIIPPVLTPLADRDQLDADAFDRLLNYLIEGGSSALFVLGSTGESPGLSERLRRDVIDRACTTVAQRVPVLVGITDTSFTSLCIWPSTRQRPECRRWYYRRPTISISANLRFSVTWSGLCRYCPCRYFSTTFPV